MNAAVITKIEYRIFPEEVFSELEIIPNSGKLIETVSNTNAGYVFSCVIDFNIAKSEQTNDSLLKSVLNRKAQFRVTDANDVVHLVGSESYPGRLSYSKNIDGTPGSFNGYHCKINRNSPQGISIS